MKKRRKVNKQIRKTQKKQRGGSKISPEIEELKALLKEEDIVELYKTSPRKIQASKAFIIACFIQLKDKPEKVSLMYKSIPKPLQRDYEIIQQFLYYAPHHLHDIPKPLQREEIGWKTSIMRDPKIFYLLPKIQQRYIEKYEPELLIENNATNYNIKGGIRLSGVPKLMTENDALGIIAAILLAPNIANMFIPEMAIIGAGFDAVTMPLATAAASNIAATMAIGPDQIGAYIYTALGMTPEIEAELAILLEEFTAGLL